MMKLILLFGFNSKTALDYAEGWYAGDAARMECFERLHRSLKS